MDVGETDWLTLAGRVRWDLMMAGIQVLPDLPPGWPTSQGSGAAVVEHHDRVRITWNAPIALSDPVVFDTEIVADTDSDRRTEVNRVMLMAIAEVLSEYVLELDTAGWTRLDVLAGP